MKRFLILLTLVGCFLLCPPASAERILLDLGHSDFETPGNWNNLSHDSGNQVQPHHDAFMIDTDGNATTVQFWSGGPWNLGANTSGTNADGNYPASAQRDSLALSSSHSPLNVYVSGLDDTALYNVRMFGSSDADGRWVHWAIDGVEKGLNTGNNVSTAVEFLNVAPPSGGEMIIAVRGESHGYWSVFDIERVPEPSALVGLLTLAFTGLVFTTRCKR